ncbi:uncharacterized protein LOC110611784 isoform X2 [Manihot esculenta]|uniref:Uncharacterized protein n=1 Tax=Manihot esculenta TaxID=3983 RepID=A0A2C9W6U6_MANES|nr:uncharacterized protein LOC110611784 isoform X2 [Manihot esculenta]OAY54404.1 hypothetical protein MANES_03G071900v8 [Manihot esculenta]
MPQELPGFYYDAEKNRYFPLKGPIPGSSRASSSTINARNPTIKATQATNFCRKTRVRVSKLLQGRELNGSIIDFNKGKCSFMEELLKIQASQAMVWKYRGTEKMSDGALDQMHIDIYTPEGQTEVDVLIAGGINGSLSLFEVGKGGHSDNGENCIPDCVRSVVEENTEECSKAPVHIWRPAGASLQMSSSLSCIKLFGKHPSYAADDFFSIQHALVTTLGSETSGGSVFILNIVEPLDLYSSTSIRRMIREVASFNCTIWTADCNHNASLAVIGTNLGAALVNSETGTATWTCRSKSDVLAQQLDQSGNIVLCGLRNGAILTVDVREKQEGFSARLTRHKIPHTPFGRYHQNSKKQWFELRGHIYPSYSLYMPSSICCLASLQSYEQYFLASSMDGSIKLYDHRMTKRGAVQSYEGHVNSHSRIQLGVDQSERFLMAGGEDCKLRLWSLKSGELLSEEKFSDSVLSTVRWQRAGAYVKIPDESNGYEECVSGQKHSWGAWCGSQEGLFYLHW